MTSFTTGGQPGRSRSGSSTVGRRSRQGLSIAGVIAAFALAFYVLNGGVATSQDSGGTLAASPAASPQPDTPRVTIEFTELNDSGVSGTATLYASGNATIVTLDLDGTGEDHPAHIHRGACDDIEPEPEYNLQNVGEAGTSTSQVDVPLDQLIDGDYVIDLHLAANQLGTLIVCGEIAGQPVNAAGTPVAIGGPGTATVAPGTEPATAPASATSAPVSPAPTAGAPTAAPTVPPPTAQATQAPTQDPSPTTTPVQEPTTAPSSPDAGVGGQGDGTQGSSGKGASLATTSGKGVGNTATTTGVGANTSIGTSGAGDGTTGGRSVQSGKGSVITTTTIPAATGTGSSLLFPETPTQATVTALSAFSVILFAAATLLWRGQVRYGTSRWRRLGL